jgi:aspartyl-tRNA(Asn)/glutamyl-tRNA(Gln) amidotransferase subunit A
MTVAPRGRTAAETAEAVRGGRTSAKAVTEAALARIAARDPALNAFTDVTRDRAIAEATRIDRTIAAGGDPGPLAGVPFAVKNLFDIRGLVTRAGSRINLDLPAATRDATAIRRLSDAGAVLLGALNMGEYAYDFTGENCHYGASRNPHDPERMSGGSSGGSGTAAASGMVSFALGSDTNGSVRVPSSLCGLFGLKPTFGRLSRAGVFPFCASLDHVGIMARSAADLALVYDVMQGPDPADPVCTSRAPEPAAPLLERDGALRIALAGGYFEALADEDARNAVTSVADALGTRQRIEIPEAATARSAAYLITATEAATLHRERLRTRPLDFDPDVRDRLLAALLAPAPAYIQAQRFRRWYHRRVMALFETVDAIIAPATPCSAPRIGQKTFVAGGETMLVRASLGVFTQPISFIGLPVVVAPVRPPPGRMPIGVQIIAAPWREAVALRIAARLERDGVCAAPVAD